MHAHLRFPYAIIVVEARTSYHIPARECGRGLRRWLKNLWNGSSTHDCTLEAMRTQGRFHRAAKTRRAPLTAGGVEDLFQIELSLPALLVITSESANLS